MFAIRYDGKDAGVVLFMFHPGHVVELKNIALAEEYRGNGFGKAVIKEALEMYRAKGYRKMSVGTANSSIANIAFYQKCGFRIAEIKKDYFAKYPKPIFEDGIRALDMIMFEQDLWVKMPAGERNPAEPIHEVPGTLGKLSIIEITEDYARQILNWRYEFPYDFYNNNEVNDEGMKELLEESYNVAVNQYEELVGFFCIGKTAQVPIGHSFNVYSEAFVDIGIGMHPMLTGKGNGSAFFSYVLDHVQSLHCGIPIRLTVAKFNERAIHLYSKFGFVQRAEFVSGSTLFITMVRE